MIMNNKVSWAFLVFFNYKFSSFWNSTYELQPLKVRIFMQFVFSLKFMPFFNGGIWSKKFHLPGYFHWTRHIETKCKMVFQAFWKDIFSNVKRFSYRVCGKPYNGSTVTKFRSRLNNFKSAHRDFRKEQKLSNQARNEKRFHERYLQNDHNGICD